MKKYIVIAFLATIGLMATDFSTYSAEDLAAMRGTIAVEDQTAFQDALQTALADLTPEERQAIMSKAKAGAATGTQTQTRTRSRTNAAMEAIGSGAAKGGGIGGHSGMGAGSGGMGAGSGGMGGGGHGEGGHGGAR